MLLPTPLAPVLPPAVLQQEAGSKDLEEEERSNKHISSPVDISHKFEKLFEDDEIFSELEDFENFEIVIREIPENFDEIKDAFATTPVAGLTIPALAEKFMADLEKKEKDFNAETSKDENDIKDETSKGEEDINDDTTKEVQDVQVIDLSELDLFDEVRGLTEDTIKDKRNPEIFLVCISNNISSSKFKFVSGRV